MNWDLFGALIREAAAARREPVRVLNLFAYTGGADRKSTRLNSSH